MEKLKLPSWIKYRKEAGIFNSILNVKKNNLFIVKDPMGIVINVLSLLSKETANLEEIYEKLDINNKREQIYVKEFYYELVHKILKESDHFSTFSPNVGTQTPELSSPISVELLVTYKCNSQCAHCLVGDFRYAKKADMSTKLVKKVAYESKKYNLYQMVISGGEPMVRTDFFELMDIIRHENERITIELETNGLKLNVDNIKLLNEYNVSRYILSLEGATTKTHEFIRGVGSFRKVITAIKCLRQYSNANGIEIKFTCGKHNVSELEEVAKLCVDLGVDSLEVGRLSPWGWGQSLKRYCFADNEIIQLDYAIKDLKAKYKNLLHVYGHAVDGPLRNGCNIGGSFAIQPNGIALPCRIFEQRITKEVILGDLSQSTIQEIWDSKKYKKIRDMVSNINSYFRKCEPCSFYKVCSYPHCLARAYIVTSEEKFSEMSLSWDCPDSAV